MNKFRTLIRITRITDQTVTMVVPGWNPEKEVELPRRKISTLLNASLPVIPSGQTAVALDKQYCHAKVNLEAETAEDLGFEDWEAK